MRHICSKRKLASNTEAQTHTHEERDREREKEREKERLHSLKLAKMRPACGNKLVRDVGRDRE